MIIYFLVTNKNDDHDTKKIYQDKQSIPLVNHEKTSEMEHNVLNSKPKEKNNINSVIEVKDQTLNFARSVLNINNIDYQAELYAFNFIDKKWLK